MLGVSMRLPEPVDLAPPLRAYIQSNYTAEELSSVSAAIATTASLRTRVHGSIVRNESDSDATIALYLSYYANLLSLQQHFPFGNAPAPSALSSLNPFAAPKQATVRVCFTWYDSFRHTAKVSDYDIGFELHSVLFDTAALYSRRATAIKGQASAQDDTPDSPAPAGRRPGVPPACPAAGSLMSGREGRGGVRPRARGARKGSGLRPRADPGRGRRRRRGGGPLRRPCRRGSAR